MVTKQLLYQLEFFEILKDTPYISESFRSVAFVVLQIAGGGGDPSDPPPWCLMWVPISLVSEGLVL